MHANNKGSSKLDFSSSIFKVFFTTSSCFMSSLDGKLSFIFVRIPISLVNSLSIVVDISWSLVVKSHALFKSFMNSPSNKSFITFWFEVKEFIISSLFNIFCLFSLSLKSFWRFWWNSLIASLTRFSIILLCPGNFINSFAIRSTFLVKVSTVANLERISNNFIKIFWLPMISAFSLLDKVIIFKSSMASLAKVRFWVLSIICKSVLGHPCLTSKLHKLFFLLIKDIKVLIIESHNSSSFGDLFNNLIKEDIYVSDGVLSVLSLRSFSFSLKKGILFLNWAKWFIRFGESVDLLMTSEFRSIMSCNNFLYWSPFNLQYLSMPWSSNFRKVPNIIWSRLLDASHISLYFGLFSFDLSLLKDSIKVSSFRIKSLTVLKSSFIPSLKNSSTFKAQSWYIKLSSNFNISSALLASGLKFLAFFLKSLTWSLNSSNGINLFNKLPPFTSICLSTSSSFGSFCSSPYLSNSSVSSFFSGKTELV